LSASAFADEIKRAAKTHHGHAGQAFLQKLTRDERNFAELFNEVKGLSIFAVGHDDGQGKRAASRLALVGLAGELATEYGLTGWEEGEAMRAAAESFRLWQALHGKGNDERRQIAERLSGFIERYGEGRFSSENDSNAMVRDRAGWWREGHGSREYLLTANAMREALRGFDFSCALDVLQAKGALPGSGTDGKRTRLFRIGGRALRLYPIHPGKLIGDGDEY
jgi:putative DNA primase/helicase